LPAATIRLADDGRSPDASANDGAYTGTYRLPNTASGAFEALSVSMT
jgi:hypothetical protein